MNANPASGHPLSNRFARILLLSLNEVAGENGMHAVFRMAGQTGLIDALPADNEGMEFESTNVAVLFQTIQDIFGVHGGHSLAYKAGQLSLEALLNNFGMPRGMENDLLKELPADEKVRGGLKWLQNLLLSLSGQEIELFTHKAPEGWTFAVHNCVLCEGRQSLQAVCAFTEGMLAQAAFTFSGGSKFQVQEVTCIAAGADACRFLIQIPQPENPPFTV
jgi:hypothetical protein